MIKLSNSKLVLLLTKLLILLAVAKAISLFVLWYLPSDGVELSVKENYQPKYQRVNFKNMITKSKPAKKAKIENTSTGSGISITNMILKGLYGTKTSGYVIVAMKSSPKKTSIIGVGESYQGYNLKAVLAKSAKFHKNGSDFILSLEKMKNSSSITKAKKRDVSSEVEAKVNRQDISYYAKNPNQIWKDISIIEVKEGRKLKGFKVTKIDPNSRFASLGLQKTILL